jgi:hypothetical protein
MHVVSLPIKTVAVLLRAVGLHSNDQANVTTQENNTQFKGSENVLKSGFLSVRLVNHIFCGLHFRALLVNV